MLEILIPREIRKSPKAMEQFLEQLATLHNSPNNWKEAYIDGEITRHFSLEVVSFGGEIHFYIRTPAQFRNIMESFLYSSYSGIEIVETADYVDRLPSNTRDIYKMGLDIFGMELKLAKDEAYPIRSYILFEAIEEEKSLDPFSTLVETLSRVKKEEHLWIQFVIRPAERDWQKKGEKVVKELKEKGISKARVAGSAEDMVTISRSPGETAVLEAVERNLSKAGFETVIRSVYFAPRSIFNTQLPQRGVRSTFNQYAWLNRFSYNLNAWTLVWWGYFPFFFPKMRAEARKQALLKNYRSRAIPMGMGIEKILNSQFFFFNNKTKYFILNTEALATLYHPPSFLVVTAPFIKSTESKRLGPPAGLPIFGDDSELEGLSIPGRVPAEKKRE